MRQHINAIDVKKSHTKQKAHIQRYEELRDRQAPVQDSQVELSSISTRMGKTTVELENICKAYGERKLIDDFSYIFLKGDRVGFIGPNGCGKSTLMKIIAGIIPQDSGQVIIGQTVKMGYYAQEIASEKNEDENEIDLSYMDPNQRVIDYVKDTAEYIQTVDGVISASVLLERFLFPPEKQYSPIGKLSGGEKKRLNLLRVLATSPNFILLDEPTNNLDIATLTILEDYLDRYDGIVVTVSHDRYFLDRTMKRIFAFEGDGKLKQYEGGYTDYVNRLAAEGRTPGGNIAARSAGADISGNSQNQKSEESVIEKNDSTATWKQKKKLKFSYKEQKEYETIEDDIAALEQKLEDLVNEMAANATNAAKLRELVEEKENAEKMLEEKMDRWEYLEELAAKIAGDEFAFCYAGELEPERIRHNADKILEILRTQHVNEQTGEVLPVPCSIGIVMSQGDTLDYTQLIRKADLAMYQAKENGKNTFVLNVD